MPSGLTSEWVKAIVAAALVGFVAGGLAALMRRWFGLTSADAGLPTTLLLFATEIAAAVPSFAIYANRTGAVLASKLPAFPALTWYAFHIVAGIGLGTVIAAMEMGTGQQASYEPPATSDIASLMIGGVIAGSMLGAVFGALQALVFRKAVRSVAVWIRWSALGGASLALIVPILYLPNDQTFAGDLASQVLGAIVAIVAGVALVPAVHVLEPR